MINNLFAILPSEDPHEGARKKIQDHPRFGAWYKSLSENTRTAFEMLYLTDVTPELILFARQVPESEWWQSVFLRVISSGNPDPIGKTLLTQHALLTVIADMEAFGKRITPRVA
ncbi:MAG TPA: hypothetical protein VF896_10015 [Anaerolineales bacterium]